MDLVIRGGTLIDGTADAQPHTADIGISGDRIAAIGNLSATDAAETIDAAGMVVAPGFIDPHTHVETAILEERDDALAPVLQGVTTILTAPDGFGWAPLEASAARELWAGTAGIHGPVPRVLAGTAERVSIAAYLRAFEGITPVNVLPQVPGAAVRFAGVGWAGGATTARELDLMRGLTREWLDAGATGLSVGLDYEPGARADEAEVAALCEVVAERGGSLAAHMRYEDAGRAAGYAELGRLSARTDVRVNVAHDRLDAVGVAALEALPRGADLAIETYLYGASSTQLTICLPAELRQGGPAAISRRMADAAGRERIENALESRLNADRESGDRIVFAASAVPARIGAAIWDAATAEGHALGVFAAACLMEDPAALFVYHHDGRPDAEAVFDRTIAHPKTIVASDGIYVAGRMHPRGYGTFPRAIRVFVRERGVVSLPAAIHAMTGRTAARYGVPDRGVVRIGAAADLVVFDPATIADTATWEAPRGAPVGISTVVVNGRVVVTNGRATASRPGRVLAGVAKE